MKMKYKTFLVLKATLLFFILSDFFSVNSIAAEEPTIVTVKPRGYSCALRNPLKGLRARRGVFNHEWATLWHSYIRWNSIENDENDGMDKIKTLCDQYWEDAEKHNIKIIPRVYLDWDEKEGNEYWPADMKTGDYSSEQFMRRVVRLVRRLGLLWDNDPRVAFIEMGIIGYWGEHHHPLPSSEMQELLGLVFTQAFKNKLVMVRHPSEFRPYKFGIHNDSWACQTHSQWKYSIGMAELGDCWTIAPMGGEVAYGWKDELPPGPSPNATLTDSDNKEHLIYTIRWLHCTQLGWVADYDQKDPKVRSGAQEVQKALGYRFILDKVCYPAKISSHKAFNVSFVVRNIGSAPFYYNWPVEVSLLDSKTRNPVWRDTFKDLDIRQWLPGDQWNKTTKLYELRPKSYKVDGTFRVPQTVESGEYIVALAILDPAGMLPSIRFAIENYFEGGRHPIGLVGVGKTALEPILDPASFDNPAEDRTLKYVLENQYTITESSEPPLSLQEAAAIGDLNMVVSLLEKGIGVDSRDDSIKKTALQHAAISGHKYVIELLLAKGADVNATRRGYPAGDTPLHSAVRAGHKDIVELLIANGADVNAKNNEGHTPLDEIGNQSNKEITELLLAGGAKISTIHMAVKLGDLKQVKAFLEQGTDVNTKDENNQTVLHEAASGKRRDMAELLIDKGADVNAKDKNGYTPLYSAIWNNDANMVEFLVSKGADVNYSTEKDYPPLHYAVWFENLDMARSLVDNGAKCDIKDQDGWTAFRYAADAANREMIELFVSNGEDVSSIHRAACVGDLDRVRTLLEQGTDIDLKDDLGWTPLYWAASMGQQEAGEFLLSKGAQADAKTNRERTPLHQAAYSGTLRLIELLVSKGAGVNVKDKRKNTPLHSAAAGGHAKIAELLIAKGANVKAKAQNNSTPLHRAAFGGHKDVVEILLVNGAETTVKDGRGRTPLQWAKQRGHTEIVELLKKHGAKE